MIVDWKRLPPAVVLGLAVLGMIASLGWGLARVAAGDTTFASLGDIFVGLSLALALPTLWHAWSGTRAPGSGDGDVERPLRPGADSLTASAPRTDHPGQAVSQLARHLAHDLNNGLTVLLSSIAELKFCLPDDGESRDLIREIEQATSRLINLSRQIDGLVMHSGDIGLIDLVTVVRNCAPYLERALGSGIALRLNLPNQSLPIVGAQDQLKDVLVQLAHNARDAMPAGGLFWIEARRQRAAEPLQFRDRCLAPGDYVRLEVADTGCGMTPEVAAKCFDPFFSTKKRELGTGLGLAVVSQRLQGMGAAIRLGPARASGVGFEIYFPLKPEHPWARAPGEAVATDQVGPSIELDSLGQLASARPVDAPGPADSSGQADSPGPAGPDGQAISPSQMDPARSVTLRGRTVLLVDDDETVRQVAAGLLTAAGCLVLEAEDGAGAIAMWEQHKEEVELLVTDLVMPNMSGKELHEQLRALKPGLRTVLASGFDISSLPGVALVPGATFVRKPFVDGALLDAIRVALAS